MKTLVFILKIILMLAAITLEIVMGLHWLVVLFLWCALICSSIEQVYLSE